MANVISNQKLSTPSRVRSNKREGKLHTTNNTVLISDAAYSFESDDGINYVRNTGAVTITLPNAAANKGRCICFLQTDAAVLTIAQNADGANIDGANADFTALDAADDWAELYSTGTEWIVVKQNIA